MPTSVRSISVSNESRAQFEKALRRAARRRHGDSNDGEIDALWDVADIADAELPQTPTSFRDAFARANNARRGTSNDAEIAALWEVAEIAAPQFGVDYDAINDAAYKAAWG